MLAKSRLLAVSSLTLLAALAPSLAACGSDDGKSPSQGREEGQTEFESAPPIGQAGSFGGGRGGAESAGDSNAAPAGGDAKASLNLAKPEETDIYRVDGNRLYFLNSYRGLMVFDITNADDPKLLGRSPVFGTPVEMFVRDGIATMVVGDWYGNAPDGSPFHGSVVRSVDARDPANPKVLGEVQVKGWARDMRVVGQNLYIVSHDYGWSYGSWYGGYYGGVASGDMASPGMGYYGGASKVVISSVKFGKLAPTLNGTKEFDGYSGAFNVTSSEILMAHDILADDGSGQKRPTGKSAIDYIGLSELDGRIMPMGTFEVDGLLNGWSADNGRWNIDLDGTTASVITCAGADYGYCNGQGGYKLTTVDFSNPAAPQKIASLDIPSQGWAATARFSNKRMYLSPREGGWSPNGQQAPTPIEIYDLSNPAAPALAGATSISGAVWLFMPMGTDRLFALGNEYGNGYSSSKVALRLLDVADATQPTVIGTSSFGDGWAWTPAAGTFKAFTRDDAKKLVVLPFSGWSPSSYEYMNGVQLIEYDTGAITTRGAAKSKGWVERGVFVKNRLVALSDQALSVIDYADRNSPKVVKQITLARNVVSAEPNGATIAQLSTDWWGYDNQRSELRVLPIANAEENIAAPAAPSLSIDGSDARVFRNGDLAYVVTTLYPKNPNGPWYATPHVQVVDLANGGATPKGSLDLPQETNGSYWSWWGGCYYWDWYDGSNAMQVGGDTLAFRRTRGSYDPNTGEYKRDQQLYLVDLSDPNAPKLASTTITTDTDGWWGNMRVIGDKLYTTHYEWKSKPIANPDPSGPQQTYWVRYYLDQIDLSDRANPKVGQRINVPGLLVGASETDPSLLYFVDYRWYDGYTNAPKDEIAVARIKNGKAYLQSSTLIDGWVGNVFVRGDKAYMSAQEYTQPNQANPNGSSSVKLHELDLTDPKKPVARASAPKDGWGWLVDVEGDRAIITSGWGQVGLDIYKLTPNQAPVYSQFARTRGWWTSAISRQGGDLFLSTGYWGVQKITLK
ncbi:MAG: beta-propeller domain-containing protein [Labilithrix sp.]|nr:beta-propeller domain-containing protein [Labilithrix sp.]